MTQYQKRKLRVKDLKDKIAKLERDLSIICNHPESVSAITIKLNWKFRADIEKQIMAGSPIFTPNQ